MEFHDFPWPQSFSMTFQAWKISFLNFKTSSLSRMHQNPVNCTETTLYTQHGQNIQCSNHCRNNSVYTTWPEHSVFKSLHATTPCLNKNVPALASCSFDKHGLILIITGKLAITTLSEMMCIFEFPCLSTFTYFICLHNTIDNKHKVQKNTLRKVRVKGQTEPG